MRTLQLLAAGVVAVALAACGKKEEPPKPAPAPAPAPTAPAPAPAAGVTAGNVTVGNAIGADKKVTGTGAITAKDTIYVSIDTTGSGQATLKAKWTYVQDGKSVPVKEDTQTVSTTGPATHEFHISKPDGWPKGEYQVEVFVDDKPAGSKRFNVS